MSSIDDILYRDTNVKDNPNTKWEKPSHKANSRYKITADTAKATRHFAKTIGIPLTFPHKGPDYAEDINACHRTIAYAITTCKCNLKSDQNC